MIQLSPDQDQALAAVLDRLRSGARTATLAGAAGTGKTTIMREAIRRAGVPTALTAPTGKAALRLRELTGQPAVTVHRVAWQGADEGADGELYGRAREARSVRVADLFDLTGFEGDRGGFAAALRAGGRALLVVDEASMVSERLRDQLENALAPGIQVLAVGDHCQIPPVKAAPGYDLERADAVLDRVHRQAAGSPILALATELRTDRVLLDRRRADRFGVRVIRATADALGRRAARREGEGRDWIALCATNRTRMQINSSARASLGFATMEHGPAVGERLMVLDNNYRIPCANGEIGTALGVRPWSVDGITGWRVDLDFGDRVAPVAVPSDAWADRKYRTAGQVSRELREALSATAWRGGLQGLEASRVLEALTGAAPAYGITIHKAQGSQWPVGVICLGGSSWMGADEWRLHYTACTRFEESAVMVEGAA